MTLVYVYLAGALVACFLGGLRWKRIGEPLGDVELAIILVSLAWPLVAAFTLGHITVQVYQIIRGYVHGLRVRRKKG